MNDQEPNTVKGNGDADYDVPEYEQHLVHVELEVTEYDSQTGDKLSTPFIQKFTEREFKDTKEVGGFAQYKLTVLHDPARDKKGAAKKDVKKDGDNAASGSGSGDAPVAAWDKGFKKADYQAKYKELYTEDADENVTIPDLKSAIEAKLAEKQ